MKTMIALKHSLFLLFVCLSICVYSQPRLSGVVDVNGKVVQQSAQARQGVAGARVLISNHGEQVTDEQGKFFFKIPIYQKNHTIPRVEIQIIQPKWDVLNPLDGIVEMDTVKRVVQIEVIVASKNMTGESLQKISQYQQKIRRLEREKGLSHSRLNAINRAMIDTVLYYQQRELAFEQTIQDMTKQLQEAGAENQQLRESLREAQQKMTGMQARIQVLTDSLYQALEAKYLRQQQYFDAIATGLANYLVRVKDVRDMLPRVKEYFAFNGAYIDGYNTNTKNYNQAFLNINDNYQSHLKWVNQYWTAANLSTELQQTYDFLLRDIHQQQILPTLSEINSYVRTNRAGKAKQLGLETHQTLSPLLQQLEQRIATTLNELRNNF